MKLTFESVKNKDFELAYEVKKEIGERYESLISFRTGRDFNEEIREYIVSFVEQFEKFLTPENESRMNERLMKYNKLVVELKTNILQATTIPSIMICGPAKYPTRKKEKELERSRRLEGELYSNDGKHARFIENTRELFDPVAIQRQLELDRMRKQRSAENGWFDFYKELDHDEISGYGFDVASNRVYITTHGKPSDGIRILLKKAAMRWSPKNERWQRILTINAIRSINSNVMQVLKLPLLEAE